MNKFEIVDINNGFCRITYGVKNEKGEKVYYALQNHADSEIRLMRCSQPKGEYRNEYYEPSHKANIKKGITIEIEIPTGSSRIEKLAKCYIASHPQMKGF